MGQGSASKVRPSRPEPVASKGRAGLEVEADAVQAVRVAGGEDDVRPLGTGEQARSVSLLQPGARQVALIARASISPSTAWSSPICIPVGRMVFSCVMRCNSGCSASGVMECAAM